MEGLDGDLPEAVEIMAKAERSFFVIAIALGLICR